LIFERGKKVEGELSMSRTEREQLKEVEAVREKRLKREKPPGSWDYRCAR